MNTIGRKVKRDGKGSHWKTEEVMFRKEAQTTDTWTMIGQDRGDNK